MSRRPRRIVLRWCQATPAADGRRSGLVGTIGTVRPARPVARRRTAPSPRTRPGAVRPRRWPARASARSRPANPAHDRRCRVARVRRAPTRSGGASRGQAPGAVPRPGWAASRGITRTSASPDAADDATPSTESRQEPWRADRPWTADDGERVDRVSPNVPALGTSPASVTNRALATAARCTPLDAAAVTRARQRGGRRRTRWSRGRSVAVSAVLIHRGAT